MPCGSKVYAAVLLITLAAFPVGVQGLEIEEPCRIRDNESPSTNFERCSRRMQEVVDKAARGEESPAAKTAVREAVATVFARASQEVLAQASNADAADASGSRVTDSLLDLLPLLQGAVTPANTGGDGVPVVLNFNSPPIFGGKTALQATLSEPQFFAPLKTRFDEAGRDGETDGLLDGAGGFGDTTYSLGWSPVRQAGNWSTRRQQLFGREPNTYRSLVNEYADTVLLPKYPVSVGDLITTARAALDSAAEELGSLFGVDSKAVLDNLTFNQLRERATTTQGVDPSHINDLIDQMENTVADLSDLESDARVALDERGKLDERFAALISNQPELQVRATYRDADRAVGPPDYALSIVYAAGSLNFNRLLDDYRTLVKQRPDSSAPPTPQELSALKKQAFDNLTDRAINSDQWRMTYALTYRKVDDYDETFEGALDGDVQKPAVHLAVPGVEEWQLRLTYSQLAGPGLFAEDVRPRLAFSLEGTWVQEDNDLPEAARRQDRILGRITYTVPTTDNLTFPVSIVFANHPEFLSEDKDLRNQLSAHVGLSYKLPRPSLAAKPPA